jgi:c-di-GMP-binding flagellar brake protein YcgR
MPPVSDREQRRGAVRQRVAVVPRVARIQYGGAAQRPVRLGITELSASGLNVRSTDELRAGDLLELVLDLDGDVHIHARVRRVNQHDRVWDAGCALEGVNERLADRIVKFVFVQQRTTLRKLRGDQ